MQVESTGGEEENDNDMMLSIQKSSRVTGVGFGLAAGICLFFLTISAWGQKTATVQVKLNREIAVVPEAGYGVHTSVYDNNFTPPDLPEKLKAAGVTALRFPGGSYADIYHWRPHAATGGENIYPIYINPNDTFDNFMTKDVLPSGAQAIITVNYGSNAAGNGGGDPAEAADWVRYANKVKGWNIHYWEIGNEIGGNGFFGTEWELDLHAPAPKGGGRKGNPALSQTAYGKNSLEFIRAMKAVDPTIKIGVGVDMPDSNPGTGNEALFGEVKDKIDFVIVHWYPKTSSTDLTVTEDIKPQVAALRDELARFAGASQRKIPIAVTETNGGGTGASRSLFATDTYLTWFEAGAITVEWLELHAGFLSDAKDVPADTPAEAYYGMQMAATAARPGDMLVEADSSTPMISAHAARRGDGGVALVLINKHPNQPYLVNVTIPDAQLAATGTRYDFGRANFTLNSTWAVSGPAQSKLEGLGKSFTVTVPATSESVLVISGR
ncbi:MAG: hypothetical protein ABR907_08130 [Terracidiphilus sp.]|jgi:hypothetical protein